jgi:hypothetical protein
MSWSINLSGKRAEVIAEVASAIDILALAKAKACRIKNDEIYFSANGSAYTASDGACGFDSSFSVQGTRPLVAEKLAAATVEDTRPACGTVEISPDNEEPEGAHR